jgi:DNA helicase-2/ATP-dependent DNA helicase PcrA
MSCSCQGTESDSPFLDQQNPLLLRQAPSPAIRITAFERQGHPDAGTSAHRVAHLIGNGADPRRILLMTFSRRAATEMTRRVERIARQAFSDGQSILSDALSKSMVRRTKRTFRKTHSSPI